MLDSENKAETAKTTTTSQDPAIRLRDVLLRNRNLLRAFREKASKDSTSLDNSHDNGARFSEEQPTSQVLDFTSSTIRQDLREGNIETSEAPPSSQDNDDRISIETSSSSNSNTSLPQPEPPLPSEDPLHRSKEASELQQISSAFEGTLPPIPSTLDKASGGSLIAEAVEPVNPQQNLNIGSITPERELSQPPTLDQTHKIVSPDLTQLTTPTSRKAPSLPATRSIIKIGSSGNQIVQNFQPAQATYERNQFSQFTIAQKGEGALLTWRLGIKKPLHDRAIFVFGLSKQIVERGNLFDSNRLQEFLDVATEDVRSFDTNSFNRIFSSPLFGAPWPKFRDHPYRGFIFNIPIHGIDVSPSIEGVGIPPLMLAPSAKVNISLHYSAASFATLGPGVRFQQLLARGSLIHINAHDAVFDSLSLEKSNSFSGELVRCKIPRDSFIEALCPAFVTHELYPIFSQKLHRNEFVDDAISPQLRALTTECLNQISKKPKSIDEFHDRAFLKEVLCGCFRNNSAKLDAQDLESKIRFSGFSFGPQHITRGLWNDSVVMLATQAKQPHWTSVVDPSTNEMKKHKQEQMVGPFHALLAELTRDILKRFDSAR